MNAVPKAGYGFVDPQEIRHPQVPIRCVSIFDMALHLVYARHGRRTGYTGADHILFLKMSSKVDSRHFCTVPIVEIRRRRFALTHLTLRVSPARNSSWGDH